MAGGARIARPGTGVWVNGYFLAARAHHSKGRALISIAMTFTIHSSLLLERENFILFIAPDEVLLSSLAWAFRKRKDASLYISRTVPWFFPRLDQEQADRVAVVEAKDAENLVGKLRGSPHTFIVIEYDRRFGEGGQDLVRACRNRAHRGNAAVVMVAPVMDATLGTLVDDADRFFYVERAMPPASRKVLFQKARQRPDSGQKRLEHLTTVQDAKPGTAPSHPT
jgi:hypothetical protein